MNQERAVLIFTLSFLLAAFMVSVLTNCREFMLYLALAPFLVAGIGFMHKKIKFPIAMLWAFSVLVVVHCIGGLTTLPESFPTEGKPLLYNLWIIPNKLKYDQIIHAYGNGIATWLCWHLLRYSIALAVKMDIKDIPARRVFLILCFLAGVGIGALNELLEFGATQAVPGDHNVGGYVNTGYDLVANTLGGAVTIVWIWIKRHGKKMPAAAPKQKTS